jgi:general secretion pathway protein C
MVTWFGSGFHDNPWMVGGMQNKWVLRGTTFVLWALVASSAAFWALRVSRPAAIAPVPMAAPSIVIDPAAVGRLLGYVPKASGGQASAAAPSLASRMVLTGVVAGRSRGGAALIAVDGRPPRPFQVGSVVVDNAVLKSVEGRRAVLGASADGPDLLTLELPPLPR